MPRPKRQPYLRLKKRATGTQYWIIRDGARDIGTGCIEPEREAAEIVLREHIASQWAPAKSACHPDKLLIVEALAAYVKHHAAHTKRPDVIHYTAQSLARHISTDNVSAITANWCREYTTARTGEGVSDQTARRDLETLQSAIRWFHAEFGLDGLAPPAVTLPQKSPPRSRWLSRDEVSHLLWACRKTDNPHVARFILIGIYTGTRPGAILGLHWVPSISGGDIDLDANIIHRRPRGSADDRRKRQPPQRIHDALRPHLVRWRKADTSQGIARVVHYHGDGVQKLRRSWARVREAAGLGPDVVRHTLRHTAATWLMHNGADLFEAAGWLGMTHKTLWDTYGHHHPAWQTNVTSRSSMR